jgi:hypothetical protein
MLPYAFIQFDKTDSYVSMTMVIQNFTDFISLIAKLSLLQTDVSFQISGHTPHMCCHSQFVKPYWILYYRFSHLFLSHPSGLLPRVFLTEIKCTFPVLPICKHISSHHNLSPKIMVEWLALIFHIWEVPSSNLSLAVGYPDCVYGFPQSLQENVGHTLK